eukprot:829386-Amphidinium_carterae.3
MPSSLTHMTVRMTRAVVSLLVFLVGLTYVFAIFFTTILACPPGDTTERCDDGWELEPGDDPVMDLVPCRPPSLKDVARYLFGSIGSSMMTLFTNGMLGADPAEIDTPSVAALRGCFLCSC